MDMDLEGKKDDGHGYRVGSIDSIMEEPKLRLMVFSFRRRMILRKEWLEPFRICFLIFKWVVI